MRHGQTCLLLAAALAAGLAAGCESGQPLRPAQALQPGAPAPALGFEAVWDASRTVLGRYDFPLDRVDRRAGLITTAPITGQYATEFWRRDAATAADLAESTVQTIYRSARVQIEPVGDGFRPTVTAHTQRSNRAMPQIISASEAIALFRLPGQKSSARRMYLMDYGWHDRRPVTDLGRDHALEAKLRGDIVAEAQRLAGAMPTGEAPAVAGEPAGPHEPSPPQEPAGWPEPAAAAEDRLPAEPRDTPDARPVPSARPVPRARP